MKRPDKVKLQSAMEYLMTYGWAILSITVILGILFQLGLFSSFKLTSEGCVTSPPYFCSRPLLSTNGLLTIQMIRLDSSPIKITGTACSASTSTTPQTFWPSNVQLTSGQSSQLTFQCPVTSHSIGVPFQGALWVTYNSGTQTTTAYLGKVSTTESYTGPLIFYLYISDYAGNAVTKMSTTGSVVGYFTSNIGGPEQSVIDSNGNLWVANSGYGIVTELSNFGTWIASYSMGSGAGSAPTGMAIDRNGNFWVSLYGDDAVEEMSNTGTLLGIYPTNSYGAEGLAIDHNGNVWITNRFWNTVREFSGVNGNVIGTYVVGVYPYDITIDSGNNVWVANYNDGTVTELQNNGVKIGTFTTGGNPRGLKIDSSGNIWVVNGGSTVTELSSTGSIKGTFPAGSNEDGIAIDPSGNIWVTNYDSMSGTITELSSTGNLITTYTGAGGGPTQVTINTN